MKLTRSKATGKWSVVFETDEEAKTFKHLIGCRNNTYNCSESKEVLALEKELHKKLFTDEAGRLVNGWPV